MVKYFLSSCSIQDLKADGEKSPNTFKHNPSSTKLRHISSLWFSRPYDQRQFLIKNEKKRDLFFVWKIQNAYLKNYKLYVGLKKR